MRHLDIGFWFGPKHIFIVGGLLASAACGGTVGSDSGGQQSGVGGTAAGGQSVGGTQPIASGGTSDGGTKSAGGSVGAYTGGTSATLTTAMGGNSSATGGASSTSSGGTLTAAGGTPAEFCTGNAKVIYHNQTITPYVTQYHPLDTRNCCMSYGMRLHTSESIGVDLQVVVSHVAGGFDAGDYVLDSGTFSTSWGAGLRTTAEPTNAQHHAAGRLFITGDTPGVTPWQMGVCIQVDDTSSDLNGTQVYIPGVPIDYYDMRNRFGIWLLNDASITAVDASQLTLDSLTLASQPLISIANVEYVEASTGWMALNSGMYSGDSLRTTLGQVALYGLPFVVVADGARIYLGGFFSPISSVGIPGPEIIVDNIKNDGFNIDPPLLGPPPPLGPPPVNDPRNDPRILTVLSETGRLAP